MIVEPIRVLVVEDEPLVARAHATFVDRAAGFETVAVAHTAKDALAILRRGGVDLVLLDLFLPDSDGLELFTRIRGLGDTVDVIVVSSARRAETVRSAIALGAHQYLLKPFSTTRLAEKLAGYRAFRSGMNDADAATLDQHGIDDALASLRPRPELPKGLSPATLDLVDRGLRDAVPATNDVDVSSRDLADRIGLSRVTTRRYLEHLVEIGRAESRNAYGAPGRPETFYRTSTSTG